MPFSCVGKKGRKEADLREGFLQRRPLLRISPPKSKKFCYYNLTRKCSDLCSAIRCSYPSTSGDGAGVSKGGRYWHAGPVGCVLWFLSCSATRKEPFLSDIKKQIPICAWRKWPPFPAGRPGPGRFPGSLPPPFGFCRHKNAGKGSAFPGRSGRKRHCPG